MKNLLFVVFSFIALSLSGSAQSLDVFNIDASGFPVIKANFYAFDKDGKQISALSPADFKLTENGIERIVNTISCPAPKPFEKVSVAMSIDISGSMAAGSGTTDSPVELGKTTATNIAQMVSLPPNEMALQTCHAKAFINLDFTTNRQRVLDALAPVRASGDNNFVEHLLNPETGLLNIAKNGKYKRVAILYTDAWWYALTPDELQRCKDTCAKYNIRFYAAIYSRPEAEPNGIKKSLRELAEATGGRLYDGIITPEEASSLAVELKGTIQNTEPCTIEWLSKPTCALIRNGEITLSGHGAQDEFMYTAPQDIISKLEIKPASISMRKVNPGNYKDTSVTITAYKSTITIQSITPTHTSFSIIDYGGSPPPFILKENESRVLKVRFSPVDSSRIFANLEIQSDACNKANIYLSGGFPGKSPAQQELRLISPNGGEVFLAGSDTLITWEGIPAQETVSLDYSLDNGIVWKSITTKASGLSHPWHVPDATSNQCLVRVESFPDAEEPNDWAKKAWGTGSDYATSIARDALGNVYVCGYFSSYTLNFNNGVTLSKSTSSEDCFIAKYDKNGNTLWAKSAGGYFADIPESIVCDNFGNIILCGYFTSPTLDFGNGVVMQGPGVSGRSTIFIAKYDDSGNILWAKTIGKDGYDYANAVTCNTKGDIIITGWLSRSFDFGNGVAIPTPGIFVAQFDEFGTPGWANTATGIGYNATTGATSDADDNVYISGHFEPPTLDFGSGISVTNAGKSDGFIAKYEPDGKIAWAKNIGSAYDDKAMSITSDKYGSIYTCGIFLSTGLNLGNGVNISSSKDQYGFYTNDGFIAKYDENGNVQWARNIGGSAYDVATSVASDERGNPYICGSFQSSVLDFGNGFTHTNSGEFDTFIAAYDPAGNIRWSRKAGGTGRDEALSIVSQSGSAYICGKFESPILDMSNGITLPQSGLRNIFVAKYAGGEDADQSDISDAVFSIVKPIAASQNIDMRKVVVTSSKDSLIQSFITNTGSYPIRIDAINITGTNASEFQLVSGIPPFTIPVGEKKSVEFRFRPVAVGGRSADLSVITQADTLHQTIIGEGVKPVIQVAASLIDFGVIEVGSLKDTTVTAVLKNIGDVPLSITNTQMLGPDKEQFEIISGGGSFSLAAGAQQAMQLRFSPKYIGRTSGQIGFDYAGMAGGRPALVQLFGQGIGGMTYVVDDSAYIGETYDLKLMLGKIKLSSVAQTAATAFKAKIAFSNTILTPTRKALLGGAIFKMSSEVDTLEITRQWNSQSSELARISMIATLGDRIQTDVELLEFDWLDDAGKSIGYDTELQSGVFKTLGICPEGGERLYDIDGKAQMMRVSPNPVNGISEITFETVERGTTRIMITDVLGRQQVLKSGDFEKGVHTFQFDTENLTSGMYILTMQTPTQIFTQQIIINK